MHGRGFEADRPIHEREIGFQVELTNGSDAVSNTEEPKRELQ